MLIENVLSKNDQDHEKLLQHKKLTWRKRRILDFGMIVTFPFRRDESSLWFL